MNPNPPDKTIQTQTERPHVDFISTLFSSNFQPYYFIYLNQFDFSIIAEFIT